MPCVWGSACLHNCGTTACACSCGAVYHPSCASAGVFTLLGIEHEEDSCGTCGQCAVDVAAAGLAFPPSAPPRQGVCDAPARTRKPDDGAPLQERRPCNTTVLNDAGEQQPPAKRARTPMSLAPAQRTSVVSPSTLGTARGGARGGAAARGARAQEVAHRGTATSERNAPRPPCRLVQADTAARHPRDHNPSAAAPAAPWPAPPPALASWGAPVAWHPPAAAPELEHAPPPAHAPAAVHAQAFNSFHPGNAAAIVAFSQLAGATLNSDAVRNDTSGTTTTRMVDLLANYMNSMVAQPQAPP